MENKIENFEFIPGFRSRYLISKNGEVFCIYGLKFIPQNLHDAGYLKIALNSKGKYILHYVHRLVMLTFKGKSKLQVNHIDGNKKNNNLSNLEYVTCRQNIIHSVKNGFHPSGEKSKASRLSLSQVQKIRKEFKTGKISQNDIAKKYGVHYTTIYDILKGRTWKHLKK